MKTIKKVITKTDKAPSLYIKDVIMGTINEMLKNITNMLNSFNKGLKFIFYLKRTSTSLTLFLSDKNTTK
jgi:hypothetical protein